VSDDRRFSDVPFVILGTISILTHGGPVHLGKSVASSQISTSGINFLSLNDTPFILDITGKDISFVKC
jgi:hypothetical protein